MSSKPELLVAPCSYQAARYAVEKWHYSRVMPAGKLVKFGVWEMGEYIGAIIYGWGANNNIGKPYDLLQTAVCELVRVALRSHQAHVSRLVAISLRMLSKQSPGLRLIVSYADPREGHSGGIYQAMNWIYVGESRAQRETLRPDGTIMHKKTAHSLYGTIKGLPASEIMWKHKYLYPLDKAMRKQIAPLAQPYPKRAAEVTPSDTTGDQPVEGGARPTQPLEVLE